MSKIRIVAAIASKTGITLYAQDGTEHNLSSSSWRTKVILDEILPALARHKVVEIDLHDYSVEGRIEKKSNGLIRFLRNTVTAIGELIMPPSAFQARKEQVEARERLTAVVDKVHIPGVERLSKQMEHVAYGGGNVEGLQLFLARCAKVMKDRGHTVDELLNFMELGDLPIANDGSIIGYKVLQSRGDRFVDCHTRKIQQKLGSRVSMPESMVDSSRRTECSTGLHIARRAYLGFFGGDVITMVKVAPEDVIAVPHDEPNKMRAAAYHIVGVLPSEVHGILRSNKPMTGNEKAAKMLADVIAGHHVGVLEEVRIGGPMGTEVKTVVLENSAPAPMPFQNGVAKALDDDDDVVRPGVTVKEVRSAINEAIRENAENTNTTPVGKEAPPAEEYSGGGRSKAVDQGVAKTAAKASKAKSAPAKEKPAKKLKVAKAVKKTKPAVATAPGAPGGRHPLADKVIAMHKYGASKRQIEAQLRLSRRSIVKIIGQG